jgi:hypothetical protein
VVAHHHVSPTGHETGYPAQKPGVLRRIIQTSTREGD